MLEKLKKRIYGIVEVVSHEDLVTREYDWFDIFIIALIIFNVTAVIIGTVQGIHLRFGLALKYFEIFSIVVFSIEYILRVYSCTVNPRFRDPIWGRIRFIITPLALIDLLAILPFYLPMLIPMDLRFLRMIRLVRISRLLKLGRYSESINLFRKVLWAKRAELLTSIIMIFFLLIIAASLLYYVEHNAQPDKFKNIPEAMWWGVITLTTVGYGDIYPITPIGKFLGSIISLMGIGLFALPAGILSAGFIEELNRKKEKNKKCPNCGTSID